MIVLSFWNGLVRFVEAMVSACTLGFWWAITFTLYFETPEPNLVSRMRILLGSYAQAWKAVLWGKAIALRARIRSIITLYRSTLTSFHETPSTSKTVLNVPKNHLFHDFSRDAAAVRVER